MDANRAMCIMLGITGNIDKPGANAYFRKDAYSFPGVWEDAPPPKRISLKEHPVFVEMYRQNSTNLVYEAMLTGKPYPVRALIVVGANVALTWPNSNKVKKALESLDFFMVIDVMENATTKLAQLVLPAASYLEKNEIKNYAYCGLPMMGSCRKAVEPLGEAWPEFKIWTELGRRMGYEDWFRWDTIEDLHREIMKPIHVDYDELREMSRGCFYGAKQNLMKYRKAGFDTPSGKIEIYSEKLASYGYPPVPTYREPAESPISTPELFKKCPLVLMTGGRSVYYTHSQQRNLASLRAKMPENLLRINPEDAGKYGIQDGDMVRVENARGGVDIKAQVTEDMLTGVVHMMHGWEESNANLLIDDEARDPQSGYTEMRATLCGVKKIEGGDK